MKCFWCLKVPKRCITLHLEKTSVMVCDKCIDNRSVVLCSNYFQIHEEDRFANKTINELDYCEECFKKEKEIQLSRYISPNIKILFKNISKYI